MRISIAGICSDLTGMGGGTLGDAAAARYAAFITEDSPDISVRVRVRPLGTAATCDAADPLVRVTETHDDVFEIMRLDNPFEAVVDLRSRTAEVDLDDNEFCLDSFVRILYSLLLAKSGGLLLHSAAVVAGEQAILLAGVSEAGKTTLCSLGFQTVLSDELVAVRRSADGFTAHGTPFWGEFVAGRVNASRRVGRIYLLRKGERHEVRPCGVSSALSEILGCVFFFGPPRLVPAVLDCTGELVESRFAGEFHFLPTPDVVAFLDEEVCEHVT